MFYIIFLQFFKELFLYNYSGLAAFVFKNSKYQERFPSKGATKISAFFELPNIFKFIFKIFSLSPLTLSTLSTF